MLYFLSKNKMIKERRFIKRLVEEDRLNQKYYKRLDEINGLILITEDWMYKLIWWIDRAWVFYADSEEALDVLIKNINY